MEVDQKSKFKNIVWNHMAKIYVMHESWQVDENLKSLGQNNKHTHEFPTTTCIMSNELCVLILTKK